MYGYPLDLWRANWRSKGERAPACIFDMTIRKGLSWAIPSEAI
jgi:hypothetical protein